MCAGVSGSLRSLEPPQAAVSLAQTLSPDRGLSAPHSLTKPTQGASVSPAPAPRRLPASSEHGPPAFPPARQEGVQRRRRGAKSSGRTHLPAARELTWAFRLRSASAAPPGRAPARHCARQGAQGAQTLQAGRALAQVLPQRLDTSFWADTQKGQTHRGKRSVRARRRGLPGRCPRGGGWATRADGAGALSGSSAVRAGRGSPELPGQARPQAGGNKGR